MAVEAGPVPATQAILKIRREMWVF